MRRSVPGWKPRKRLCEVLLFQPANTMTIPLPRSKPDSPRLAAWLKRRSSPTKTPRLKKHSNLLCANIFYIDITSIIIYNIKYYNSTSTIIYQLLHEMHSSISNSNSRWSMPEAEYLNYMVTEGAMKFAEIRYKENSAKTAKRIATGRSLYENRKKSTIEGFKFVSEELPMFVSSMKDGSTPKKYTQIVYANPKGSDDVIIPTVTKLIGHSAHVCNIPKLDRMQTFWVAEFPEYHGYRKTQTVSANPDLDAKPIQVLAILPVGHDKFNAAFQKHLSSLAGMGVIVEVTNLEKGPDAQYTVHDVPHDEVVKVGRRAEEQGYDAIIMACFGDPGVSDLQLFFPNIVTVGAGAAAVRATHGVRFGVVAVSSSQISSEPEVGMIAHANGMTCTLQAVSCSGSSVGDLADSKGDSVDGVVMAADRMIARGAKMIVLGCTGMSPRLSQIRARVSVPVIDPLAEALQSAIKGVRMAKGVLSPN